MIAVQFVVNDIQRDFLDVRPEDQNDVHFYPKIEEYSDVFEACDLRWSVSSFTDSSNMCCLCLDAVLIMRPLLCIIVVHRFKCGTELNAGDCRWNMTLSKSVRSCS
jgi:hypothetical protein